MPPTNRDFHEISTFRETSREGSGKLLGCLGSVLECLRVSSNDFRMSIRSRQKVVFFEIFFDMLITILHDFMQLCDLIRCRGDSDILKKSGSIRSIIEGRLYESSRAVNTG